MFGTQNTMPGAFNQVHHSIGPSGRNASNDVRAVQRGLSKLGHFDLAVTGQADGYPGQRLIDGIKAFQKQAGLKEDGTILPGGPTEAALRGDDADQLTLDKRPNQGVAPDMRTPPVRAEHRPHDPQTPMSRSERLLKELLYAIGGNDPRKRKPSYGVSVGGIR